MKKILIKGIVQGVGFRPFIYKLARRFGLRGYVKNLGDAGVEILAIGDEGVIDGFMRAIEAEKVRNARIDEIRVLPSEGVEPGQFGDFRIMESGGFGATGTIPPDHAMCTACLEELFDPGNARRHCFPFNSCIDCGSRLSTIHALPYDRPNTSLARFPMCDACRLEFEDPDDRRLHYQGISCSRCGPSYRLHDDKGEPLPPGSTAGIVHEAVSMLRRGKILAIKGITGTHIAVKTTDDEILRKLRETFGRPQKPFAVMAGSIEAIKTFACVSQAEEKVLLSPSRPIVLLKIREGGSASRLISPGLHTIGAMLPYAGIHHLIFESFDEPLLMTSANFPGQPMLTENDEILGRLRGIVDGCLLHDLEIRNRCDDSVVRLAGGEALFIRRSRGYAPSCIKLPFDVKKTILCLGSELNNTVCLIRRDEAYLSQYVGDTTHRDTLAYLDRAARTILDMTRTRLEEIDAVAVDLNPAFDIRPYAESLCRAHGLPLHPVQHHMAHAGSLLGESGAGDMVVIAVDGLGHGSDGKVWGGEIIEAREGTMERAAHLKEQRMPGGDAATFFPLRMLAGILFEVMGSSVRDLLAPFGAHFRHGEQEIGVLVRQLEKNLNVVPTTSCGRVLDALSALLNICYRRTYDGEPAMKLEAAATEPACDIPIVIDGGILDTTRIVAEAARLKSEGKDRGKIAASCQAALARGLARMAIDVARRRGIRTVGLSGGVAYNEMIHLTIQRHIEEAGLRFVTNTAVPCGDGGVSIGQGIALAYTNGWIEPRQPR